MNNFSPIQPLAVDVTDTGHRPSEVLTSVPFPVEPDKWEISTKDITLDREIGKGFFGTVYKGNVVRFAEYDTLEEDKPVEVHGNMPVAVKMLRGLCSMRESTLLHMLLRILSP